jgi:hypothetical protein
MFPSRDDFPTIVNGNDIVPVESNNTKEAKENKRKSLMSLCLLIIQ